MFSTIGMRIQNEQSGSTSLFAQPMAMEAVPEEALNKRSGNGEQRSGTGAQDLEPGLEAHSDDAGGAARGGAGERWPGLAGPPSATVRQGHLALLKRWYYRPEAKRTGEIFFPDGEGWPIRAILRGVGRIAAKSLTAAGAL